MSSGERGEGFWWRWRRRRRGREREGVAEGEVVGEGFLVRGGSLRESRKGRERKRHRGVGEKVPREDFGGEKEETRGRPKFVKVVDTAINYIKSKLSSLLSPSWKCKPLAPLLNA